MINSMQLKMFRDFGPGTGLAMCLGDQIPTEATGFGTAKELFKSLGYGDCLDLDYNGNARIVHDLNEALPQTYHGMADLLFDGGTSEHVANIGESLRTTVNLLKVGGVLFQNIPIYCRGDSYYAVDPMLQRDFFQANGFDLLFQGLHANTSLRGKIVVWMARTLPRKQLHRLRDWLKASRAKEFVKKAAFSEVPSKLRWYPASGTEQRQVPIGTETLYIGRKIAALEKIYWPAQDMYERKLR